MKLSDLEEELKPKAGDDLQVKLGINKTCHPFLLRN